MDKWIEPARRLDTSAQDDLDGQLTRVRDRHRARGRRRVIAGALATAAIGVVAVVINMVGDATSDGHRDVASTGRADHIDLPVHTITPPLVAGTGPSELALGDGSVVTPLAADSKLLARTVDGNEVRVELVRGSARFEVPDHDGRRFVAAIGGSVGASGVTVETRDGAFRIVIDQQQVIVMAERGRLVVAGNRDRRVVEPGDVMTFVLPAPADTTAKPRPSPPGPSPSRPSIAVSASWQELAARGDYAAAWTELAATRTTIDVMVDLMAAGDVSRLSGHPEAAVTFLSRAVSLHPDDPRGPLASFTLGRVHLEDLGAPRDAAQAFARAYALGPDGPLAEDALAREVEAWSRAGETDLAHARAVTYAQRYPAGRRIRAVRRFGGLDRP
ncbi:MAG TPA: hypothetical protein VGO00_24165 [Kofleriaceae bacterium]|jgi:transmembrane sensor|nr:hypothetical protein [Kofleriaceae bacterium]